jgi:paraquat-inducible protein B
MARAGDIVNKVDRLPLDQVAAEVHQATGRLAELSTSPELTRSLQNLERSLDNVQSVTTDARRQVRPILAQVSQAAAQAEDAVRAARGLMGGGGGAQNAAQTAALPDTLYELTRAARSLRELADYLDRHPEALIAGRSGSD